MTAVSCAERTGPETNVLQNSNSHLMFSMIYYVNPEILCLDRRRLREFNEHLNAGR